MVFIIGETFFVRLNTYFNLFRTLARTIKIQQETIDELQQFDLLVEGENDIKSLNDINLYGQMNSLDRQSREKM